MKNTDYLLFFGVIMVNSLFQSKGIAQEKPVMNESVADSITISIIYDNNAFDPALKTAFGFSCLVRTPDNAILFDTGSESATLMDNMRKLGINPGDIEIVVLSHNHWDHVGGLIGFLEINPDVTVYIPASFPDGFKEDLKKLGAQCIDAANSTIITPYARTTGELEGPPQEQSLLISSRQGLIVITGCAHPGIVNVVERAKELTGEKIYIVLGGFHQSGASTTTINDIIENFKKLGVKKVAPSHCTGDKARELFEKAYSEDYIESGVGKIFRI